MCNNLRCDLQGRNTYSVTDVAFRHFGHIVRMDGNYFQSITIPFDYVYSILELENTIAPVLSSGLVQKY